jgi:hypothetical protein
MSQPRPLTTKAVPLLLHETGAKPMAGGRVATGDDETGSGRAATVAMGRCDGSDRRNVTTRPLPMPLVLADRGICGTSGTTRTAGSRVAAV